MFPRYLINFNLKEIIGVQTDVLIVGSGVAGLTCALSFPEKTKVFLLTKENIEESNTKYAQGGIAVAWAKNDSPKIHFKDTLKAGVGLNDEGAVKILVNSAKDAIKELISLGAKFDKEKGKLILGREAAHQKERIVHAQGDATGAEVERVLINELKKRKNIFILENIFALDILTDKNYCFGILAWDKKNNEVKVFFAQATILATGGAGYVYQLTTNPQIATGDGIAMAFRAGCEIMDMEFFQFHPTALYSKGFSRPNFLISEAVRGEGAILKNIKGEEFMEKYHCLKELAPRDIVTRAIWQEMKKTKKDFVYLDITHLKRKVLEKRFPNIYDTCKKFGINIHKDLIPVAPAAHYLMGGIKTNIFGETNIKGLYACGEAACLGIHGANRLASNSTLEGLVFGKKVALAVLKNISKKEYKIKNIKQEQQKEGKKISLSKIKKTLRKLMWQKVGIIRSENSLKKADEEIKKYIKFLKLQFSSEEDFEIQNLIAIAYLITTAGLKRKESRGAHFRLDFPKQNDKVWKRHIILKR